MMQTRGQRKKQETAPEETKSAPKTKKQILEEKRKLNDPKANGVAEGKKKVKKDESPPPEPSRRQKNKSVRVDTEEDKKANKKKDKPVAKPAQDDNLPSRNGIRKKGSLSEAKPAQEVKPEVKKTKKTAKQVKDTSLDKGGKSSQVDQPKEKEEIKKIQFKGKVPIDDQWPLDKSAYHVLEYQGKVYSATLNQTSVQNNNNKYYIIQVLQSDTNPNTCFLFTRWGRVGVKGQSSNIGTNQMGGISAYNSKYHEKHKKGDYREIDLNYGEEVVEVKDDAPPRDQKEDKKADFEESKLPKTVKKLIELIFDLNMMNRQMVEIGYNVSKMPLGKLSKENIMRGYKILQELMQEIKGKRRDNIIDNLTNEFYSYIPHDFGFMKMKNFVLNDEQKVKKKIEMLEALAEIKVATNILSSSKEDQNKLDSNYQKLNRDIRPINRGSEEYDIINKCLQSTHGTTHTSYSLEIEDLFSLSSEVEDIRYTKDIGNKTLLWHGSRLTNFVGILSQGLRIAPPEAPVTGYMFGKGVYFADMSSKSANYCFTSRQNNTGILLLCEVALGEINEKYQADYYASNLPPGKHSTQGLGRTGPNPANAVKLSDGVVVPMGPGESTNKVGCTLLYNEFIVYDIAQIKIRYLLRTKFSYKQGAYY